MPAVAVDGRLYVLGGHRQVPRPYSARSIGLHSVPSLPVASLECFDPSNNSWTALQSMGSERAGFKVAVVGPKILALGGTAQKPATMECYNTVSGRWEAMPSCSAVNEVKHAIAAGQHVVVFGHFKMDRLHVNHQRWTALTLPTNASSGMLPFAVSDDSVLCIGKRPSNDMALEMLAVGAGTWQASRTPATAFSAAPVVAVVTDANVVYTLESVLTSTTPASTYETMLQRFNREDTTVQLLPLPPQMQGLKHLIPLDNAIYGVSDAFFGRFDPKTLRWAV